MARTNKYSSINFNDIYEKKLKPSASSSSTPSQYSSTPSSPSSSSSSPSPHSARTNNHHGRMLVLTRPTPKPTPVSIPQPQHHNPPSPSPPPSSVPDQTRLDLDSDSISLRPLGRSGSGSGSALSHSSSLVLGQDVLAGSVSPKPDRFVPPHLRPGFVGREERLIGIRPREYGNRQEDGRPKSGGGNERMRRGGGGEPNPVEMSRPGSFSNRPSSRG